MEPGEDGAMAPLIELRGIGRVFEDEDGARTQALADVTLAIKAGELVCITGQSGSGKSTLLNILGCLGRPTAGEYRFDGQDVTVLDADALARLRRDEFGFVFQAFNLLESATSQQNVELPARYLGLGAGPARDRARQLLDSLGLSDRLDHRPGELSGGEQQRTSIARALMNGGRVILADEPTGALDSAQGEEVMLLLKGLAERGHTVVIVSHDAAIAAGADRRIEMRDGRVASDSGAAASESPPHVPTPENVRSSVLGLSALLRDALTCLGANSLRTALMVLSVTLGVGSVVALLSLAEGIERRILETTEANRLGIHSLGSSDEDIAVQLTPADADAIRSEIPNVTMTHLWTKGPLSIRRGTVTDETDVRAETRTRPTAIDHRPWPLARGSFLTEEDSERREQVVVLGPAVAEALFEAGTDPVGEHVQIEGFPFLVKGVLEQSPLPRGVNPPEELVDGWRAAFGDVAYVPFHTAQSLLAPAKVAPEFHIADGIRWSTTPFGALSIEVRVADPTAVEAAASAIRDLLIRTHGREGFIMETDAELADSLERLWGLHPVVQGGVAAVALLVAIVGVTATTLVAVGARRHEIGIRMAIGARRRDIASQFLVEAAIATFVGGAAGILLGYWAAIGIAAVATPVGFPQLPVAFASWFVPVALGAGVATGLVAGIMPARRAARLDPVEALAAE